MPTAAEIKARPSHYAWVITFSYKVDGEKILKAKQLPIYGPSNSPLTPAEIKAHPKAQEFRLLDGDGDPNVRGYFVDLTKNQVCTGFEPLEDYGIGGLGCTSIEYLEGGEWKGL
jgi:hypothetical protein